ncbi:MAG: glycosyltransferase family 39 protein [Patescibacteria group bacterium]|nr:glycosyltransferase family 39 protein [Patescibacteria group bacterium]
MLFLQVSSALQETQTIDEGVHLAAGFSYLMKNDFRMNPEHPPLLKELAALPLFIIKNKLQSPFSHYSWLTSNEWQFARDLLYENSLSPDVILFLGRIPFMLLSALLCVFVFKWSRELFSTWGGLLSLTLFCLWPTIIAHGRYVTTDVGVGLLYFLTIYYFYKYLKYTSIRNMLFCAGFFALAISAKFSALLLIPTIFIIYVLYLVRLYNSQLQKTSVKRFLWFLLALVAFSFIAQQLTYGFEWKIPWQDPDVQNLYRIRENILSSGQFDQKGSLVQHLVTWSDPAKPLGKFLQTIGQKIPVPSYSYWKGFVILMTHNYGGHMSYLMGNYSQYGWWYYFPIAFLVKTPLSILALTVFLIGICLYGIYRRFRHNRFILAFQKIPLYSIVIFVTIVLYLGFSMASSINIGERHIIPLYPFLAVALGAITTVRIKKIRYKRIFSAFLTMTVAYSFVSVLCISPDFLAYFNEFAGGPDNGPRYLVDSNIDWGQDVKKLKHYLTQTNTPYVCMSYFGQAKLDYYGIDYRYLPTNETFTSTESIDCLVAISVTSLLSSDGSYEWLRHFNPTNKIGYSIYLYDFRN